MKNAGLVLCAFLVVLESFSQTNIPHADIIRLSQAIRIPTVQTETGDISNHAKFLEWLETSFAELHSQVKHTRINELSQVYTWKGTDTNLKPVLFLMHYDVVPVSDTVEWTQPAFSGHTDHEFIWGRGAIDNKGPMIAFFEAAEHLIRKNFQPVRSVYFAVHHDEETGGKEGAANIARYLAEKKISFEFIMDEGGAFMHGVFPGLARPIAFIATAEKGYADFKLSLTSTGGHSSIPSGENAIDILSTAIYKLNQYPIEAKLQEPVISMLKALSPYLDRKSRFAVRHMKIFKKKLLKTMVKEPTMQMLIKTTLSPTMISSGTANNVIPAYAEANINARILSGETVESTREEIKKIINDPRITITESASSMDPSEVSPMHTYGWNVLSDAILEMEPGIIVAPLLSPAMSDSRHYKNLAENIYRFCPVVLSPENKNQIHGKDEKIAIHDYQEAIRFYEGLLKKLR